MFDNPFWAMFMGNSPQVGGWDPSMWGGGGMYPPGYNFGYPTTAPPPGGQQQQQPQQPKQPYVDPKTGYTFADGRESGFKQSAAEKQYFKEASKTNRRHWWALNGPSQEWDPNWDVNLALRYTDGRDGKTSSVAWNTNSPWYTTHLSDAQKQYGEDYIKRFNTQFNPTGGAISTKNVLDTIKGMTDAQRAMIPASNTYLADALKLYNQNKNVDPSQYTFDKFGKVQSTAPGPIAPKTPPGPTPPSLDRMSWYRAQIKQARKNDNMDRVERLKQNRTEYRTR